METRSFDQAVTVFLGDYVDRGLGSMRVVEQLARGEWPTPHYRRWQAITRTFCSAFLEDAAVA